MSTLPIPHQFAQNATINTLTGGVLRVGGVEELPPAVIDLAARAFGVELQLAGDEAPHVRVTTANLGLRTPRGQDPRSRSTAGFSEAYAVVTEGDRLVLSAESEVAVFRGLLTIASLVTDQKLPGLEIEDAPEYAWRGLSLDVVRRWFPLEEVKQIIDLLAILKLNVLHLHLTDSQAWRFAVPGRPALTPDGEHFSAEQLRELNDYAAERQITVVPELDMPGHVAATVGEGIGVEVGTAPHAFLRYLEWENEGVAAFISDALDVLVEAFDGPYLHLGGDEAVGDPRESYVHFIAQAAVAVRERGKRLVGWQETSRAHVLGSEDLSQLWIAERDRFDEEKALRDLPEQYHPFVRLAAPLFAESVHDPDVMAADGVGVIVSSSDPFYLDRRPAEASAHEQQEQDRARLGHPGYDPTPSTDVLQWDPATQPDLSPIRTQISGVEAALWCESVTSFDDAATLLLPRLALMAHRVWHGKGTPVSDVRLAIAAQSVAWERLGFSAWYRSVDLFGNG